MAIIHRYHIYLVCSFNEKYVIDGGNRKTSLSGGASWWARKTFLDRIVLPRACKSTLLIGYTAICVEFGLPSGPDVVNVFKTT